jgi:hypothetical protein
VELGWKNWSDAAKSSAAMKKAPLTSYTHKAPSMLVSTIARRETQFQRAGAERR